VDSESHLQGFFLDDCVFTSTMAGLIRLLRYLSHGFRRVRNHADEPNRTVPSVFCNAN